VYDLEICQLDFILADPPQCGGASYSNGPRCPSVCLSYANITETKQGRHTLLGNSNRKPGFPIQNFVSPFWVFSGWHFSHSHRNGLVELVTVMSGSVGSHQ